MNRRASLKLIPALGIASVWLNACGSKHVEGFLNMKLTAEDVNILNAIQNSILPHKNGENAAKSNEFVLKYVDKIISTNKRNSFNAGFQELKAKLKGEIQYTISDINPDTIQKFWDDAGKSSELIDGFLNTLKRGATHFYKTEEAYMTNQLGYKLVPGEFQPCVKIS